MAKGKYYHLLGGTYRRIDPHVGDTNVSVIRKLRKRLKKSFLNDRSRSARRRRHAMYRAILQHHREAGELFRRYRF